MKFDQVLKNLGLRDKEIDIYISLLKIPGAQAASTIANRNQLNRTTTYKTLINLSKKGLITKTQQYGTTCFFAEDPEEKLKILIDRKQKELGNMNQSIIENLPLLNIDENNYSHMPKIRYYEGIEGIKQIYEIVLKEEIKDQYRYGDITKIYEALGVYTDEYISKRQNVGITTHAIMPLHKNDKDFDKKNKNEKRDVLYIPYELFPIEGEIRIFGNKVAIISLRKESPIGVIVESNTISKMFYYIFMLTWNQYKNK